MKVLKNYLQTILLLVGIVIGAIIGICNPNFALKLKPLGDLFLNLIFMIIVPLIFFSIAGAIANVGKLERIGKIMSRALIVFVVTSIVAVLFGILANIQFKPLSKEDIEVISTALSAEETKNEVAALNGLQQFVNSVTTSDFSDLLSRQNILQLILFSLLIGIATVLIGEKGAIFASFLKSRKCSYYESYFYDNVLCTYWLRMLFCCFNR